MRRRLGRIAVLLGALVFAASWTVPHLAAQDAPANRFEAATTVPLIAQRPAFEVASVRPTVPGPASMTVTDTHVNIRGYSLRTLVRLGLDVERYQLSAPNWLDQLRFDVQAVIPSGATRDMIPEMMHALLIARFGLVTHTEQRAVPAYDLIVDKGGIKMVEVEPMNDLTKDFSASPGTTVVLDNTNNDVRTVLERRGDSGTFRVITSRTMHQRTLTNRQTWRVTATRMTMKELATVLLDYADRPVVDETGLSGLYRFEIELPVRISQLQGAAPVGISVFDEVKRLGLILEPRRSPIDVIVVDKIERTPTEN
jgi:uncharacterized protein (TIGR03435 family)